MKLLGLAGGAGSGKDFTYQWIKEHRVGPTHRLAFADGVRQDVVETLGIEHSEELFHKPYAPEVRAMLQWWGTELRRAQDPEYWVKYGMEQLDVLEFGYSDPASNPEWVKPEDLLVVFTDVRFANEVNAIELRDGLSRLVLATRAVRKGRLGELPPSHASEEMDFETGGVIHNDVDGSTPVFDKVLAQWMEIDSGWVIDPATGQIVAYEPE